MPRRHAAANDKASDISSIFRESMSSFHRSKLATATLAAATLVAFAGLHGCGDDVSPAPPVVDEGKFGSMVDVDEFNIAPQALPVEALRVPPGPISIKSSHLLTNTPAVAQQGTADSPGSPGSCEAQSFGSGLGSYTAARNPDGSIKWDAAQPGNEMSAAYQFALAIKDGFATCSVGKALPYLSRMIGYGSPTTADVPYQPLCSYFASIDLNKTWPDAKRLRIGSFATFNISNPDALALIKGYLANDQAVAFSGAVFKSYGKSVAVTDGVFYDVAANLIPNSGHGQLIVGYDDTLGTPGKTGALLVQNSFGTDWPPKGSGSTAPPGKLYWSYDTFTVSQKLMAVAYPFDPSPPSGTMLTASASTAPVGSIERAFQWAPSTDAAYLVLMHHFADAVRITGVTVKEPAPGADIATGKYGQYISSGYTYLRRTDGKQFLAGTYQVSIAATTLEGAAVSYTASVAVGHAEPAAPAAASMSGAAGSLFDTLGSAVTPTTGN